MFARLLQLSNTLKFKKKNSQIELVKDHFDIDRDACECLNEL